MSSIRQIIAVTWMSLLGLPQRLGASIVVIIGIAGVVAVLLCVFAMATGFTETAAKTGRADRVIVLSKGAATESTSQIRRRDGRVIFDVPVIKHDSDGTPIASGETLAFIRLTDKRSGRDSFVTLRGIDQEGGALRPEIKIIEGRMFQPGVHEIVVGRTAESRLDGLEVGKQITLPQGQWTIVGVFETNGDSRESEILTDVSTLMSAFRRTRYSSVTAMLETPRDYESFSAALTTNPALAVEVRREQDYYTEATRPTAKLLSFIAYTIGAIMSLGAVCAALNTMYSSVSTRSMEIAMLRAIGYDGSSVVTSVLIEALALSLLGAVVGAAAARFFFNGSAVSILPQSTQSFVMSSTSPITYSLHVGFGLVALGIACAIAIGLIGGLFPAIRAARLSVAEAIRSA